MKATSVLLQQHRHFEYLLSALETDPAPLLPLLDDIARQLDAHLRIKQEIFYPAIAIVDAPLVLARYEEHALCAMDLDALLATDPDDPAFGDRVRDLRQILGSHLKAEETHLFPAVERMFDRSKLFALGASLSERFDELLREDVIDCGVPYPPASRTQTGARLKDGADIAARRARDRSESAA